MVETEALSSTLSRDELAVVYSVAILIDDDVPITVEKLLAILRAANVEVELIWPTLYARALQNVDAKQLLMNIFAAPVAGAYSGVNREVANVGETAAAGKATEASAQKADENGEADDDDDDDDLALNLFD